MVTDDSTPADPAGNPAIIELELGALTFIAHHTLNAIEVTITDPTGQGIKTWIGADRAPAAALHFCAATVRLIEGITT